MSIASLPSVVLIVDDERAVRDLLAAALGRRALAYLVAASAEEALGLLQSNGVGCLLTDKNLPGLDGLELIRRTRKLQPHCACILITGYASLSSAVEALRLGATDYLEKPFDDMQLVVERVERAMAAKRIEAERDALLSRVQTLQAGAKEKDEVLSRQSSEIELFGQVLEARTAQAAQELRKQLLTFEQRAAGAERRLEAAQQELSTLLETLRRERHTLGPQKTPQHGELELRIERILQALEDER